MNAMTYEKALSELNEIVTQIESGNLEIDKLSPALKRAQELLAFCKNQLTQVENDVNKILNEQE